MNTHHARSNTARISFHDIITYITSHLRITGTYSNLSFGIDPSTCSCECVGCSLHHLEFCACWAFKANGEALGPNSPRVGVWQSAVTDQT